MFYFEFLYKKSKKKIQEKATRRFRFCMLISNTPFFGGEGGSVAMKGPIRVGGSCPPQGRAELTPLSGYLIK